MQRCKARGVPIEASTNSARTLTWFTPAAGAIMMLHFSAFSVYGVFIRYGCVSVDYRAATTALELPTHQVARTISGDGGGLTGLACGSLAVSYVRHIVSVRSEGRQAPRCMLRAGKDQESRRTGYTCVHRCTRPVRHIRRTVDEIKNEF